MGFVLVGGVLGFDRVWFYVMCWDLVWCGMLGFDMVWFYVMCRDLVWCDGILGAVIFV